MQIRQALGTKLINRIYIAELCKTNCRSFVVTVMDYRDILQTDDVHCCGSGEGRRITSKKTEVVGHECSEISPVVLQNTHGGGR